MKKYHVILAATAAAVAATPASAEVAGVRLEALVGYDAIDTGIAGFDDESGAAYGLGVGYDLPVSEQVSLGLDAEVTESSVGEEVGPFDIDAARDIYVGGRATFALNESFNLYVKGGYTNQRVKVEAFGTSDSTNFDGFRAGLGAQYNLGGFYIGGEYRYSNYEDDLSRNQVMALVGVRFD